MNLQQLSQYMQYRKSILLKTFRLAKKSISNNKHKKTLKIKDSHLIEKFINII